MTPFFIYLVKSTLSFSVFFLLFKAVMGRMKTHQLNRCVMLGIMFVSAIFPMLNISFIPEHQKVIPIQLIQDIFTPVVTDAAIHNVQTPEVPSETSGFNLNNIIHLTYLFGIILLSLKLLMALFSVTQMIRKAEHIQWNDIMLAIVTKMVQPFTFMNRIVLNRSDYETNRSVILEHEKAHIRLNHASDLLLLELFTLFHWFNPLIWLYRRDLKLIHEYQADEAVIHTGIDAQTYQLLVLEKAVGKRRFAMANQFIQKPILKRFKMIQKTHKPRWAGLKLLLFVPLAALMLQAFSRPEAITNISSASSSFSVRDSAQQWLNFWTLENVNRVRTNIQVKKVHVPTVEEAKNGMPIPDNEPELPPIKEKNVLIILINKDNQFMVEGQSSTLAEAITGADNFINGKPALKGKNDSPEYTEKVMGNLGAQRIPKGVISIQFDKATDRKLVDELLRGIGESYLKLRQEKSNILFHKNYFALNPDQKPIIDKIVPVRISFAYPKAIAPPPPPPPPTGKKVPPPPPPPPTAKIK